MFSLKIKRRIRSFGLLFLGMFTTFSWLNPVSAQMVSGTDIPEFKAVMGVDPKAQLPFRVVFLKSTAAGNILWPGEQAEFTFQIINNTDQPLVSEAKAELISYGTKGRPGDIWVPEMFKKADHGTMPFKVDLKPKGFQNVTVRPTVPDAFGAYALVLDLGEAGRAFGTAFVRTFKASNKPVQYPQFCMDVSDVDVLVRLGTSPNRVGTGYKVTTDKNFEEWYQNDASVKYLRDFAKAKLAVTLEIGGGSFNGPEQPMGMPRPWLDDKGVMQDTKFDLAWTPDYDADFRLFVKRLLKDFGWPRGTVNGIKLWNEPWNGISISGWGADDLRYRDIYRALCEATREVCKEENLDVLVGGCDSGSNTFDKLFGDGKDDFLQYLDFCSIHYQGMSPPSTVKNWMNRKGPNGRVRIWDTESWVANVDDRVSAVIATNLSTGHDRAVGIYGGNVCTEWHSGWNQVFDDQGKQYNFRSVHTWSVAAAVGAASNFIGERKFKELLFKNGLPWVMVFDGNLDANGKVMADDGTVVVVGDIGEEFGSDCMLFRTARGFREYAHKVELRKQLEALPADTDPKTRQKLVDAIAKDEPLSGATMTFTAQDDQFGLYDFYGNPISAQDGKIVVPLDHRGFFLRANPEKSGSFAALIKALQTARIDGIEPLAKACPDLTSPIGSKPELRLKLTNVLNRPVTGKLTVSLGKLTLDPAEQNITIAGNETKEIRLKVTAGEPVPSNSYPLSLVFDAGADGKSVHAEDLHVNVIAKRTIKMDGRLDDWEGVLPQSVASSGVQKATLQEFAWQPFKTFDQSVKQGFATGYLAYDDDYFYFAAKIADTTPHPGTLRFETRNEDDFFYPEKCYRKTKIGGGKAGENFSVRWTGFVVPKQSGKHTFVTLSDDGVRLWVNGEKLVDNWTIHGGTEDKGEIELEAGKAYPVKLEYMQGGGGACMRLSWEAQGLAREIVPATCLRPEADKGEGLNGEYFYGTNFADKSAGRVDKVVNFENFANPELLKDVIGQEPKEILEEFVWPEGVRRYSYRKDPILPTGNFPNMDNVQIAFNVLDPADKWMAPCPPGTMPGYIGYVCTDYEYALNQVAETYGGGTEIWRLQKPGMPHKHFYPHSAKSSMEGPVKDGKLIMTRDDQTRYVECAIPWGEIPDVKKRLDAGQTIKFSFRVNDDAGVGCLELSKGRSVAKRNGSFTVDWTEHWANEIEFAFGK